MRDILIADNRIIEAFEDSLIADGIDFVLDLKNETETETAYKILTIGKLSKARSALASLHGELKELDG